MYLYCTRWSLTFPRLFVGLLRVLPMLHLPTPNSKPCFHLVHQLYSHYCKCSLYYKHIQNDVVSWLSALLAFILLLQVFKTSTNWLKKEKVTVTAFLLVRLHYQHVNSDTVFHQLTLVCSLKTIVFRFSPTLPDKSPISQHFADNCRIPWHCQVFQTTGHRLTRLCETHLHVCTVNTSVSAGFHECLSHSQLALLVDIDSRLSALSL